MASGAATLFSAVIGGITSMDANSKASEATDKAVAVQQEQLGFDKDRYERWKGIYGELEEGLSEYYKNLTGDKMASKYITEIQKAGQSSLQQTQRTMAQRGISGSGIEAALTTMSDYATENSKANIRANKEEMANQAKTNFLKLGINKDSVIAGQMGNDARGIAQTYMNEANAQHQRSAQGLDMLNSAIGAFAGMGG